MALNFEGEAVVTRVQASVGMLHCMLLQCPILHSFSNFLWFLEAILDSAQDFYIHVSK